MPDIEVPLSVRIDSQGNEFYVAKPTKSQVVDLSKATFLIFHPDDDDEGGAMIVKTPSKKKAGPGREAVFLKELARAEKNFSDGYVGLGFFLNHWRPRAKSFPRFADERRKVLDRLIDSGRVEVYEVEDDGVKEAIRTAA